MEDPDTDTLRKLAPCWTLAGDERLLTILQNTHQRLVTKCQETDSQLERMATALDDASISLQNVNNQFMALSSSQFIERRVYDDDVDVAAEITTAKESPKLSPPDELSMLKRSIAVIESTHEVITILHDSDTESDTDDDLPNRLVMKPKDVYADRPLPYIIGSEPWKSKWHAGLLPSESDSDSSTSKVGRESDQYSQSETEDFDLGSQVQGIPAVQRARKLSDSSSELLSEPTPPARPSPADVASELARRLGGGDLPPKMVDQEPPYSTPVKPIVRTVYKSQEPIASTVFPDEPPPIDSPTDSDSDIFASLHRKQPYDQPYSSPPQDLFGGSDSEQEGGDIFSDFANQPSASKPVSLFDAGPTPHMFDKQRQTDEQSKVEIQDRTVEQPAGSTADADRGVKKPVGGISLFGSSSGTENIGAAILQRNRRKSASSEESGNESQPHTSPIKEQQVKREKDIFDDLFAKSESKKATPKAKSIVKDIEERNKKKQETVKKDTPKPVDLFSDNLFDDIDDIFTDVIKSSKDKKKSIFEDDDNLFSEIADTKPEKPNPKKGGLFDSDDDLFSEHIPKKETDSSSKIQSTAKTSSNLTEISEQPRKNIDVASKINEKPVNADPPNVAKGTASIFDDEEDDDIFSNIKTKKETPKENVSSTKIVPKIVDAKKKIFNSPSLFGDDDDESDLFTESSKLPDKRPKDVTVNKVSIETLSSKSKDSEDLSRKDIPVASKATVKMSNASSLRRPDIEEHKSEIHIPTTGSNVINESSHETKITGSHPSTVVANNFIEEIVSNNNIHRESNTEALTTIDSKISDENKNTEKENSFESKDFENTSKNFNADVSVNSSHLNIDNKTTTIEKLLDVESHANENLNDQAVSEQETKSVEISNNSTNELKNNDLNINVPDVNEEEVVINPHNIIQDNSSQKDIFASPINIPSFEIPAKDNAEIDENMVKMPKSDIFTDIISEPPDFEKPKESKRSKNVNALFDDDSDDETLFFKRDDVITDEKPEDFTVQQDRLFDLFINEPPDEDFTHIDNDLHDDLFRTLPKPKLPSERNAASNIDTEFDYDIPIPNDTGDNDRLSNKFTTEAEIKPEYPKPPIPERKNTKPIFITNTESDRSVPTKDMDNIFNDTDSMTTQPASFITTMQEKQMYDDDDDDELFKSLPVNIPDSRIKSISRNQDLFFKTDEELFRSLPHNINTMETHKEIQPVLNKNEGFKLPTEMSESSDLKSDKAGAKKLGKLKVGLNINVNALLPGASPKKVKLVDNTDGQTQSQNEIQKDVPQLPKLVSFDGEPESKVLDNKLSKERPRIQVKRRPSSRKARKEAVRKSGIDFGDDSTDNSSSIDDPPKAQAEVSKNTVNVSNNEVEHTSDENSRVKEEKRQESEENKPVSTESEDLNLKHEKHINIARQTEINTETSPDPLKIESEKPPVKSDSTTKIVYILNDEDIFNTNAIEDPVANTDVSKNLNKENITKNTENVETNLETNTKISEPIIKTLGNTYKHTKSDDKKKSKSLFGDEEHSDNDEIFKSKKPAAKTVIFDSDSDGELFGTSKKDKRVEKVIVKRSLFGDEDDADDLFGVKTTKRSEPQQPSKSTASTKEPPKTTQAVFEDPLSLFGDDV